ncbi:hypothetical protein CDAR_548381 [Caerostris darwini]|uniref:Uncharacterized protein n=1 Tax=Caerostris darwini TaxID=1538125 RepID=A0AAV4WKY9_9ARAC|nr:hypothetical protein CDAR_548381 [Caerostris darwini]
MSSPRLTRLSWITEFWTMQSLDFWLSQSSSSSQNGHLNVKKMQVAPLHETEKHMDVCNSHDRKQEDKTFIGKESKGWISSADS